MNRLYLIIAIACFFTLGWIGHKEYMKLPEDIVSENQYQIFKNGWISGYISRHMDTLDVDKSMTKDSLNFIKLMTP